MAGRQLEQNRRRDVIRQIADHAQPSSRLGRRRSKIELQDILLDDGYASGRYALVVKLSAQSRGKLTIELNRHYASGTRRQRSRQRAAAGANLHHRAPRKIAQRAHNALDRLSIHKKILSELGFLGHLLRW